MLGREQDDRGEVEWRQGQVCDMEAAGIAMERYLVDQHRGLFRKERGMIKDFNYLRPATAAEALDLIAKHQDD